MASAVLQPSQVHHYNQSTLHSTKIGASTPVPQKKQPHDVVAQLNYYKDPGDGSRPLPSIVGKPETYERPAQQLTQTVYDIRGRENDYTLDKTGFQIIQHESKEKEFLDDERIKEVYYPEIEQILRNM
jgi:hypothetical protein